MVFVFLVFRVRRDGRTDGRMGGWDMVFLL